MKKTLFYCLLFFCFSFNSYSQADDPLRGIYVDKFVTITNNVFVNSHSILGVDVDINGDFEKEVELLNYAQQNHFTTLVLYDLSDIFKDPPFLKWNEVDKRMESLQEHLCRFMKVARQDYGITRILGAIGGSDGAEDVIEFNEMFSIPTTSFQFSPEQLSSPSFNTRLESLALQYPANDPMLIPSEVAKYVLRTISMNGCDCEQTFDGFVTEFEFWVDDLATNNSLVLPYEILMNDLNMIKAISTTPLTIAVYYGKFAQSTNNLTCPKCPLEFTDGSTTITENCDRYCASYIGDRTTTSITNSQPLNMSFEGARRQYIYLASDLAAAGVRMNSNIV